MPVALVKTWFPSADAAARSAHVSILYKGGIFAHGGTDSTGRPLSDLTRIEAKLGGEESVVLFDGDAAPRARMNHAGVVIGGHLFIFGGWDGREDTLGDMWTAILPGRAGAAATWARVHGGADSGQLSPRPRRGHTMCVHAGRILLFGGEAADGTRLADVWSFDPLDARWTCLWAGDGAASSDGPEPRSFHTAVMVLGAMFVFGGISRDPFTVHRFRPDARAWERVHTRGNAHPAFVGAAASVGGGRVLLYGGADDSGTPSAAVSVFDAAQGKWHRSATAYAPRRCFHTLSAVLGGSGTGAGAVLIAYGGRLGIAPAAVAHADLCALAGTAAEAPASPPPRTPRREASRRNKGGARPSPSSTPVAVERADADPFDPSLTLSPMSSVASPPVLAARSPFLGRAGAAPAGRDSPPASTSPSTNVIATSPTTASSAPVAGSPSAAKSDELLDMVMRCRAAADLAETRARRTERRAEQGPPAGATHNRDDGAAGRSADRSVDRSAEHGGRRVPGVRDPAVFGDADGARGSASPRAARQSPGGDPVIDALRGGTRRRLLRAAVRIAELERELGITSSDLLEANASQRASTMTFSPAATAAGAVPQSSAEPLAPRSAIPQSPPITGAATPSVTAPSPRPGYLAGDGDDDAGDDDAAGGRRVERSLSPEYEAIVGRLGGAAGTIRNRVDDMRGMRDALREAESRRAERTDIPIATPDRSHATYAATPVQSGSGIAQSLSEEEEDDEKVDMDTTVERPAGAGAGEAEIAAAATTASPVAAAAAAAATATASPVAAPEVNEMELLSDAMTVMTKGAVFYKHPFHGGNKAAPQLRDIWMDPVSNALRWSPAGKRMQSKKKKGKDGRWLHAIALSAVTSVTLGASSSPVMRGRKITYPWRCICLHTSHDRSVDLQAEDDATAAAWLNALHRYLRGQLRADGLVGSEDEARAAQKTVRNNSGSLGSVLLGGKARPKY